MFLSPSSKLKKTSSSTYHTFVGNNLLEEGGRWLKVLFVSFCWQKSPYFVVAIQLKIFVKVVFQMIFFFSKVSLSRERQHNREDLEVSLLKMQIKRTWNAIVSFINNRFCKNSRWRFKFFFPVLPIFFLKKKCHINFRLVKF